MSAARRAGAAPSPPESAQRAQSELRRRRDRLAEEVAELQWALGGLTYEMAIRDHFRVDVLLRRAAMLQERDAELAEVERLLHMQESPVAGNCPACGAVRSRSAVYCWQCGSPMMERSSLVSDAVATELSTAVTEVQRPAAVPAAGHGEAAGAEAVRNEVTGSGAAHGVMPAEQPGALTRPASVGR